MSNYFYLESAVVPDKCIKLDSVNASSQACKQKDIQRLIYGSNGYVTNHNNVGNYCLDHNTKNMNVGNSKCGKSEGNYFKLRVEEDHGQERYVRLQSRVDSNKCVALDKKLYLAPCGDPATLLRQRYNPNYAYE